MSIKYALYRNNVTSDPDDYAASVEVAGSLDLDGLADRMIAQGSTTTRADILAVLEDAIAACELAMQDGFRVNFGGLIELFPRVKGVFTGPTDAFDPARHTLDVGANPGVRVRKTVREQAVVEKVEAVKPAPNPIEYRDVNSDTTNDTVTVGGIGQLSGSRLKYDDTAADEGVYFVATAGGETKVDTVQKNKPSQVVFLVPATLVPGTYHVEVRARMGTPPAGPDNRELRIGRLDATLTV